MKLIFSVICLLILLLFALIGFLRRSNRALITLGSLSVSALLALPLSKLLVQSGAQALMEKGIPALLERFEMSELLAQSQGMSETVTVLMRMLVSPLLYFVVFLALAVLLLIVQVIICGIFRVSGPKKPPVLGRVCGLAVGLVCGVLCVVVMVAPVCGYLTLAEDVIVQLQQEGQDTEEQVDNELPETVQAILDIKEAPIAKQAYDLLGDVIFDGLTTVEWDGDRVVLREEIGSILSALDSAKTLMQTPATEYSAQECAALDGVVQSVEDSAFLSHTLSSLLSDASNAWLNGGMYMGVSKPQIDERLDGIIDAFLTVFTTSDASNLAGDLKTFADVFDEMVERGLFASLESEGNEFNEQIADPELVGALYAILDQNPRMAPVKKAISDAGMRILVDSLGGAVEDIRENHGELLDDMAEAIKQAPRTEAGSLDTEALTSDITSALADNGIEVDASAVKIVADSLADVFASEDLNELTNDEIIDLLLERFSSVQSNQ